MGKALCEYAGGCDRIATMGLRCPDGTLDMLGCEEHYGEMQPLRKEDLEAGYGWVPFKEPIPEWQSSNLLLNIEHERVEWKMQGGSPSPEEALRFKSLDVEPNWVKQHHVQMWFYVEGSVKNMKELEALVDKVELQESIEEAMYKDLRL